MIFLIGKMFIYLLFALGLGGAAGWLWRNLQAASREADLERALMESRSRLPQLDTTLRAREQRLEGALAEIKARDQSLAEHQQLLAERDRAVGELERACAELRQRLTVPATDQETGRPEATDLELHLGEPGTDAPLAAVPALPQAPARSPEPASTDTAPAPAVADLHLAAALAAAESERDVLQNELASARTELDRARLSLAGEKRRVSELTRERDLQHQSLKAMEQQLDLARDDDHRVANG